MGWSNNSTGMSLGNTRECLLLYVYLSVQLNTIKCLCAISKRHAYDSIKNNTAYNESTYIENYF